MKPKAYQVLEMCVETGVARGYRYAFKHEEDPPEKDILDRIEQAVMEEICEWFNFDA